MKSAPNPLFRLVVVASAAFLITVLMMIVSAFAEGSSTAQWMNRNGVKLIGIEVVLVIALSVLAMKFDRSQPLSEQDEDESAATGDATDGGDAEPTQQA